MYQMNDSERADRATIKALHLAVRGQILNPAPGGPSRRHALIAWGFVRGFPYRRIERTCREHNEPNATDLARALAPFLPAFAADLPSSRWGQIKPESLSALRLGEWLADPSGAIPAPIRIKVPYAGQRGNPRDLAALEPMAAE